MWGTAPRWGGGERLAHAPRRRACRPGQTREARGRQTAASQAQTRGPDGELQRPRSPRPACPLTRSPPPSPSEPRFLSVPEGAKLSAEEEEEEDTGLLPRTRPEGLAESAPSAPPRLRPALTGSLTLLTLTLLCEGRGHMRVSPARDRGEGTPREAPGREGRKRPVCRFPPTQPSLRPAGPIGLTSSPPAGRTLPPPLQLDVVRSLVTRFWLVTNERGQDIALLRTSFRGRGAFLVPLASHSASRTVNVMPGAVAAWGVDATLGRGAGQSSDPRRRPDGRLWTTAK